MSEPAGGPYAIGLDKNAANYVPLTPIGHALQSRVMRRFEIAAPPVRLKGTSSPSR
jgi:hypothetical protein